MGISLTEAREREEDLLAIYANIRERLRPVPVHHKAYDGPGSNSANERDRILALVSRDQVAMRAACCIYEICVRGQE